jgi:solute carrier family 39 (zinc transporter), member 9
MLLVEQFASPHSHSRTPVPPYDPAAASSDVSFDANIDLEILEREQNSSISRRRSDMTTSGPEVHALPMTLGLVVHGIADGMALGVSALDNGQASHNLSIIVFLALLVHKGV